MNNFLQFEVWHDCNNGCKFCHNKYNGNINKDFAISFIKNELNNSSTFINFNELGFIGGEFFDTNLIDEYYFDKFMELVGIASTLLKQNIINKLYIATALMFVDKSYLNKFLTFINESNIAHKTLICTSYDIVGRFSSKTLSNWKNNITYIHAKCPQVQTHIEMITTGAFIQSMLQNTFNILDFQKKHKSRIDFISPHIIDYMHTNPILKTKKAYNAFIPNFFPTRQDFLIFVQKFMIQQNVLDINTFLSKQIRADKVYTIIDNNYYVIDNRRNTDGIFNGLDKKLNITYIDGYVDSDIKLEDDIEAIKQMV